MRARRRSGRRLCRSGADRERRSSRNLLLHHHRRRLGRLPGRGAAQRERQIPRASARSGAARHEPVDPYPARLHPDLHRPALQLDVRQRARAAAQRPHPLCAARQGAGRHQLDQRHGLHARHADRLRRLATARLRGLGLRRRAAVLPQGREPAARRESVPRRRRSAQRLQPGAHAARRRAGGGGDRGRHPGQRRLQRRPPGGCRLLPDDDVQPPALELGARLSRRRQGPA